MKKYSSQKGFTLIELMVATTIFMIVMLVAMGSLVTSSNSAKKSRYLRTAMDNVNFAMDSMTRSLRTATDYSCIRGETVTLSPTQAGSYDCPTGGNGVAFTPTDEYGYCHNDPNDPKVEDITNCRTAAFAMVSRGDDTFVLKKYDKENPLGVDMISANVNIEELKFFVEGSDASVQIQPRVYIIMRGVVTGGDTPTPFALQTMVTQRTAK